MIRYPHCIDSGAHSWINLLYKHRKSARLDFSQYKTQEFWDYVDAYANFIKENKAGIDQYINVDVIRSPELSWEVQKYLENEHGLKPIPVVHCGTELRWLRKYIEGGYSYIGIGGRIKGVPYTPWADSVFEMVCDSPGHLPCVKTHGFSVTTHRQIVRYPWYSVDSTTWKKMSYFGQILVPPRANGDWCFKQSNLVLFIDPITKYTERKGSGRHYLHLPKQARRHVRQWLKEIGVPWGKRGEDLSIIKHGVTNDNYWRCAATIRYYMRLTESLPKWPWPFLIRSKPNLLELL